MSMSIKTWPFWRSVLAEFLCMVMFIFIGISAAIGDKYDTYPDYEVKVALTFGLTIATLAQCIGHISGAHLNPAITLGFLATCQMSFLRAFFYILAQMLGAVVGSAIVYGIRQEHQNSLGVNKLNDISPGQGFAVEFLLTFQLVLCVISVTDERRDVKGFAPLAIGLSVAVGHLAGISYTGCGINPARSFGPALIQQSFEDHWVYWAAPMSAGLAAALLYDYLLIPRIEAFRVRAKVLCQSCFGPEADAVDRAPLLEDVNDDGHMQHHHGQHHRGEHQRQASVTLKGSSL